MFKLKNRDILIILLSLFPLLILSEDFYIKRNVKCSIKNTEYHCNQCGPSLKCKQSNRVYRYKCRGCSNLNKICTHTDCCDRSKHYCDGTICQLKTTFKKNDNITCIERNRKCYNKIICDARYGHIKVDNCCFPMYCDVLNSVQVCSGDSRENQQCTTNECAKGLICDSWKYCVKCYGLNKECDPSLNICCDNLKCMNNKNENKIENKGEESLFRCRECPITCSQNTDCCSNNVCYNKGNGKVCKKCKPLGFDCNKDKFEVCCKGNCVATDLLSRSKCTECSLTSQVCKLNNDCCYRTDECIGNSIYDGVKLCTKLNKGICASAYQNCLTELNSTDSIHCCDNMICLNEGYCRCLLVGNVCTSNTSCCVGLYCDIYNATSSGNCAKIT